MWTWEQDKEALVSLFFIDAGIDLTDVNLDDKLFTILLHDLIQRDNESIMRTKIQARIYDGRYASMDGEYYRDKHRHMMKLKNMYAINKQKINMGKYIDSLSS